MTSAHMSDVGGPVPQAGVPYAANIAPFLSPLAIPCQQPPYGMVSAVDLKSGKLVWTRRFDTSRDSGPLALPTFLRSEEHTSELQSLMRISYAVFCLKKKKQHTCCIIT